jgi:phenylpropionate dioxygenase-like ring-hydroxylating dioxygenase large terminal subunit
VDPAGGAVKEDVEVVSDEPLIAAEKGLTDWRRRLAISSDRYFSREVLAQEKERVFMRTWLVAGRESDAPSPGDYFTLDILGEPVLIVCQEPGRHRAFYNVCRHRGRRLVDEPRGNASLFRCLYHSWTYDCGGKLKGAPYAESFPALDCDQQGLKPIRLESWGGFLFVNFDDQAAPLAQFLGPLAGGLEGWFMPSAISKREHTTVEIKCNWKIVLDNFFEFYHIIGLHQQRKGKIFPEESAFALFRDHAVQVIPMERRRGWPGVRTRDWRDWLSIERSRDCGFGFHWTMFPNISVHVNPHVGATGFLQITPHATDPERCYWRAWRLAMDELETATWIDYQVQQDLDNMEPAAAGLRSRGFDHQQLSLFECRVAHFHSTIDDYLQGRR